MYDSTELVPTTVSRLPNSFPEYTVYLTGSAGGASSYEEAPALELLQQVLAKADENAAAVFLGDNLSPFGMPPKAAEKEREAAENQLKLQLDVLADFPGKAVFLPGDKDWKHYQLDGVERQEDFLEEAYGQEVFLPENACGDPLIVDLTPNVALLVINSQWFLSNWNEYQELNEGCAVQTRAEFRWRLGNLAKDLAFKHVIVAMHHPLISRGPRGGEHNLTGLFKNGYLGPITNWWRSKIGMEQDLYAPKMEELRSIMRAIFADHPSVVFASGHEHLLQYGTYKYMPVFGSGTAVQTDPGKIGQRTVFTAGRPGFAEVRYYANGEAWLVMREAEGSPFGKTIFEQKLYSKPQSVYKGGYDVYLSGLDSFTYAPFENYRKFSPFFRWAFGDNNRELFETPLRYPILRLDEFEGGVEISKRGGGGQTNSLRLTTKDGRDYALRSVRKDPTRLLPAQVRVGPAIQLTRDLFFTANPFAALTAAKIAEAVDLPHANPRMVYLPPQPKLASYEVYGDLNGDFGGDLYLLEERPNDEWIGPDGPFGEPDDIDGRDDVLEKIREEYDHKMDQHALVRARLVDLLLGDFDRHGDQWRYAAYEDDSTGVTSWRVIPRDRDQAMLKIDGKLLRLAAMTIPAIREIQNYGPKQPWIKDFTFQARMLDRRFLNELTREDWEKAAYEIQQKLSDQEIEAAFDEWPEIAKAGRQSEYIKALKQRRDDLLDYAQTLYEFQAKEVYIVGTDEDDFFEVFRRPNGNVEVSIYAFKGQKKRARYYHRTFYPDETKSVQLFGLREEDRFEISGRSDNRGIKVRIVPGPEEDQVITTDTARAIRKRTRVYAWPDEDKLELGKETERHLTTYQRFNHYDYRGVEYDYGLWLPSAGFNVDDGVQLGLAYQEHFFTFHRHFRQSISGTFATASRGVRVDYDFRVVDLAPRLDFSVKLAYQTPSYAINFFGRGNETLETSGNRSFHRIRQRLFGFYPELLFRNENHEGGWSSRLLIETLRLENNPERFLGGLDDENPLFDQATYLGTSIGYSYENVDDQKFPRDGMQFEVSGVYKRRLQPMPDNLWQASSSITVYQHLWQGAVLATRVGGGLSLGNYFFYDGQLLGGTSLRGYRRERFNGDAMFYQNLDFRQQFARKALKSRLGLFGSFDHGRVWIIDRNEAPPSDVWHYSIGGGIFVQPLSLFTFSVGYYVPEDGSDAVLRLVAGFDF